MSTEKKQEAFGFADREPVWVVGYPKSGNTWLSRLLGDALNSPISAGGKKLSLADGGYDRPGNFIIRQAHLTSLPKKGKIVFIMRDPRDVTISVKHYWKRKSLMETIKIVGNGEWPVPHGGGWGRFNEKWWRHPRVSAHVFYESLNTLTVDVLRTVLAMLDTPILCQDELKDIVERQAFDNIRTTIKGSGDLFPYSENIQLRNLRKGIAGDWKNHYKRQHGKIAEKLFGDDMRKYGFDAEPDWWKELPVKE